MSQNVQICEIGSEVIDKLKKFRFRKEKTVAAIVFKIDKKIMKVVLDEEHEDISVDDLQAELPECQPRYIVLSYIKTHDDGRVSYPLCFIFISPEGCKPEDQMMYAGSKLAMINESGMTKTYELRDKDDLTEEWLLEQLKKK